MADSREALRKLQSGQTLTNAERQALGLPAAVAPTPAPTPPPAGTAVPNFTPTVTMGANTSGMFVGPIPTGTTRTATGYKTPDPVPAFPAAGTFVGWDYQNNTQTTGTLRRKIVADGKGGTKIDFASAEKNPDYVSGSRGGGGGGGGGGDTGSSTQTFTWTDPDTGVIKTFNSAAELNAFVATWTANKSSAAGVAAAAAAAKAKAEIEAQAKRTAQQDFKAALTEMGLADLAGTVDEMIRNDLTAAQIKLELPKQPAYKLRFPGMQALRDAGQAINEATYISMERGYIQTLGAYGLDAGVFGTRSELGKYIANMVSPREFEERVNIAKTRVADNTDVVKQLKGYYPEIDDSAVVSYLLNPTKGMDIIKKQVRAAEIGAAATFAGFSDLGGKGAMGTGYAESLIGATGTADLAALKKDFGQAKTLSRTQSRLAGIEGQAYNDTEAVNAAIAQEQASIMASQRRAERETKFRFGGTSGVGSSSLRSTTNQ
jgi:hypothetical protein